MVLLEPSLVAKDLQEPFKLVFHLQHLPKLVLVIMDCSLVLLEPSLVVMDLQEPFRLVFHLQHLPKLVLVVMNSNMVLLEPHMEHSLVLVTMDLPMVLLEPLMESSLVVKDPQASFNMLVFHLQHLPKLVFSLQQLLRMALVTMDHPMDSKDQVDMFFLLEMQQVEHLLQSRDMVDRS